MNRIRVLSGVPWTRALLALAGALQLAGCGGTQRPLPATVRAHPSTAQAAPAATPQSLPALPVRQTAPAGAEYQIENLELVEQDVRVVVRSLAESFGLDYQLDPAVAGRVTTQLRFVTLDDALRAIVEPLGYAHQIEGGVLRVTPMRLSTQIFTLDYLSMARAGVGTTIVQRRLGFANGQPGTAGGPVTSGVGNGAGDAIQRVTVADLWEEMRISLEGLVFEAAAELTGEAAPVPTGGGGVGGGGLRPPGAYSRTGPDGRKLIINPMGGTILVTAPPEKLAEVATFIATIQNSVQRQVLIEAKIVEVALNRSFQFGIDWSFLRNIGDLGVRVGQAATGVQFTLGGSDAPELGRGREVDVVLQALDTQGDVHVLSAPRVAVMNNQPSVINVTQDEVFFSVTRQPVLGPTGTPISFTTEVQPQQVSVGIVLDVLAQISPDNTIMLNVRPVVTDLVRVNTIELEDGTQATAPVIDRRETDTVVRVRGGETIVIGWLMQTTQRQEGSGVPGLRELPVLGPLFGRTTVESEKRELVIFITPTIIAGQPTP